MTDDMKAVVERFWGLIAPLSGGYVRAVSRSCGGYNAHNYDEGICRDCGFDGVNPTGEMLLGEAQDLLAHLDGEDARTAAAVAAATALCAKQCAEALERSSEDEREVSQSLREQLIAAEARIAELEYERVGNHLVSFSAYDVLSRAERDRDALRASWREAVEVAERNAIDCAHLRHSAIALEVERDALRDRLPTCEELEYARAMVLLKQRHEDPLGDDLSDHVYRLMAQAEVARKMANDAIFYGDKVDAPNLLAAMDEAAK